MFYSGQDEDDVIEQSNKALLNEFDDRTFKPVQEIAQNIGVQGSEVQRLRDHRLGMGYSA